MFLLEKKKKTEIKTIFFYILLNLKTFKNPNKINFDAPLDNNCFTLDL